jgi:hypothetical protein
VIRTPDRHKEIVVDLMGQEGNAYWLLGHARKFAEQLGYDKDEIQALRDDMTNSDYNHLVAVFEIHFGDYVTLEADDDLMEAITSEVENLKVTRQAELARLAQVKRDKEALVDWMDKRI